MLASTGLFDQSFSDQIDTSVERFLKGDDDDGFLFENVANDQDVMNNNHDVIVEKTKQKLKPVLHDRSLHVHHDNINNDFTKESDQVHDKLMKDYQMLFNELFPTSVQVTNENYVHHDDINNDFTKKSNQELNQLVQYQSLKDFQMLHNENDSHNSSLVSLDEAVNENLYFSLDELLKDLDEPLNTKLLNELLPASLNDYSLEKMLQNDTHNSSLVSLDQVINENFDQVVKEKLCFSSDELLKDLDQPPKLINSSALVPRKKYKHWNEEEQRLFLVGLKRYGWGNWAKISKNCVPTRTKTQVASHAQKYMQRIQLTKEERKRRSIHDITLEDIAMMVPPNNGQQYWIPTSNYTIQQQQPMQQLQNRIPTPNFAMMQPHPVQQQQNRILTPNFVTRLPQQVQQFSDMSHQMNEFGYPSLVPHYIEQHNWVPPIQTYKSKH